MDFSKLIKIFKKYSPPGDFKLFIKNGKLYWTNIRSAVLFSSDEIPLADGAYDFSLKLLEGDNDIPEKIEKMIERLTKEGVKIVYYPQIYLRRKPYTIYDGLMVKLAEHNIFIPLYVYNLMSKLIEDVDCFEVFSAGKSGATLIKCKIDENEYSKMLFLTAQVSID